ncbi:TetR/AcrR family transcriptional regulator [Sphingomonas sanguinis]|uniref:TetR family transcriptional regulator n=1 Tax=Sphingomonas sanguinis TaxID=33051 RepID=A0A147ISH5_9SPHN|nr:TetR/AcrR family transcriptional regulator [Sphingomonas sanguinis]KTT98215.1 TetR family transcriptional regulator [Sphingomonas sanguinis]
MAAARGRPRSFDRDQALARMMQVFWQKGYEGAQLTDLLAAVGITPPSFYAAFGSKEAAFLEAVDLYIATVATPPMRALEEAGTIAAAIRGMLEGSITVALSSQPGGCFLILGVVNCQPENESARKRLREARRKTHDLIRARLLRAIEDGELAADTDVERLTAFYHGILQAISFQARDGATREQLTALIEPATAPISTVGF